MKELILLAIALSIPLAALGFAAGATADRTAGLRGRAAVWAAAFVAPMAILPATLLLEAARIELPIAAPMAAFQAPQSVRPTTEAVALSPPSATAMLAEPLTPPISRNPFGWASLLLATLMAGALVRWALLAFRLASLARLVRSGHPLADPQLAALLEPRLDAFRRRPIVLAYEGSTPVLVGLRRPAVLLPQALADELTLEQLSLVCAHELAHLKAGDNLKAVLTEFLLGLYWFNPFLFAVRRRLSSVREELCDEAALSGAGPAARRSYGQTLVRALQLGSGHAAASAFIGAKRDEAKRRLRRILSPPQARSPSAALAAVTLAGGLSLAAGGLSLALAADGPAPPKPAPPKSAAAATSPTVQQEQPAEPAKEVAQSTSRPLLVQASLALSAEPALFACLDADSDGQVSKAEYQQKLKACGVARCDSFLPECLPYDAFVARGRDEMLFRLDDADGDGALTRAELNEAPKRASGWRDEPTPARVTQLAVRDPDPCATASAMACNMPTPRAGTLIRGQADDVALPVEVITREELRQRGSPTTDELIRSLSAVGASQGDRSATGYGEVSVNLRGLGRQQAEQCHVLTNGLIGGSDSDITDRFGSPGSRREAGGTVYWSYPRHRCRFTFEFGQGEGGLVMKGVTIGGD